MGEWKKTQCNFCAVSCGLEMEVEDDKIVSVRPDPASPRSKGYCCRKGRSAKYYVDHGDRLDYPLKKVGDHFERISWEQAMREIGEKTKQIKKDYGPRSFAVVGCGLASAQGEAGVAKSFISGLGSQYWYNPIGIEFMGSWWSHGKLFGDQLHFTEPDDEKAEMLIFWGSNAYVSHQILASRRTIRGVSRDPDRMVITVDPRLSETAKMSDMHIMPKMGSDALLLRALIALIIRNGWEDKEYIKEKVKDYDQALAWFKDFDIEKAFEVCGVPYAQMEEFARLLTTKKWGCHQDLGLFFNRNNTISCYLILVLQAVCGVALVDGGCIVSENAIAKGATVNENDPKVWRTAETKRFPVLGIYPDAVFPQEVLNHNPQRLRAAYISMSNPVNSFPDSQKMREALSALDLLVVIDVTTTETTKLADYVLPAKCGYEAYDFNTFQLNYPECVCQLKHPVITKQIGERKEGSDIWVKLCKACGVIPEMPEALHKAAEKAVETGDRMTYFMKLLMFLIKNKLDMGLMPALMGETLGKAMGSSCRSTCWGGLLTSPIAGTGMAEAAGIKPLRFHPILSKIPVLKNFYVMDAAFQLVDDHPEGAIVGVSDPKTMLKRHVKYKDHKIRLYCDEINEFIKRITPEKEAAALTLSEEYPMLASSGRHSDEGYNGGMRNPATNIYRKPYTLAMNPEDAQRMGFVDGQEVRVISKAGEITVPVEITYTMAVGYCMVPHHFGFEFQGKTDGMAASEIASTYDNDEITGNPFLRYVPCRIEAI